MPYETIMYVGIAVAAIGFAVSAVIFFQLRIPSVISGLTGRTAKREIELMQKEAADRASGKLLSSDVKEGRGKTGSLGRSAGMRTRTGRRKKTKDESFVPNEENSRKRPTAELGQKRQAGYQETYSGNGGSSVPAFQKNGMPEQKDGHADYNQYPQIHNDYGANPNTNPGYISPDSISGRTVLLTDENTGSGGETVLLSHGNSTYNNGFSVDYGSSGKPDVLFDVDFNVVITHSNESL